MLLHAPDQLLFKPGMLFLVLGALMVVPLSFGPRHVLGRVFDFHYLFYGGTLVLVGLQAVLGALIVRDLVGGVVMRPNRLAAALCNGLTLGRGLLVGGVLAILGGALEVWVLFIWFRSGMGPLSEPRRSVLGMMLIAAAVQVTLFAFLHAVLRRHRGPGIGSPRA